MSKKSGDLYRFEEEILKYLAQVGKAGHLEIAKALQVAPSAIAAALPYLKTHGYIQPATGSKYELLHQ